MSTTRKEGVFAVYGNIGLIRSWCESCERMALAVDGKRQCCGSTTSEKPEKWKRVVEPEFKRRLPSRSERAACLERQEGRCIYCDRPFGSYERRKGKFVRLRVNWDHFVPYVYSANNSDINFVAACQICNHIKSDKMFQTIDEARVHIQVTRYEGDVRSDATPFHANVIRIQPIRLALASGDGRATKGTRQKRTEEPHTTVRAKVERPCLGCYARFQPKRTNQFYCKPACRSVVWRKKQKCPSCGASLA